MDVRVGLWRKLNAEELMLLNRGAGEDSWESLRGDCKKIQLLHSEDQPWDFFGKNDAKAETPVLWPPHAKSWLIGKDNQSILKISPGISLEGMMLKLKLQYFGHLMRRVDSLEKTDAGRDWGQEEKGTTEDEMAGWHHWLEGRESEWTPGVGDGQGSLACWDTWGHKESDTTEWLNWTELNWTLHIS